MARNVILGLLGTALAAIGPGAQAQTGSDARFDLAPYLQASAGLQKFRSTSSTGTAMDLGGSDTTTGVRLVAGVQLNRHVGVEGAWYRLPTATVEAPAGDARYSGSAWTATVTGTLPVADGLDAVARLGVGRSNVDVRVAATGYASDSQRNLTVWGLGARYGIGPSMTITVDYDQLGKVGKYALGDHVKADMFSVGVQFKF